MNIGRYFDPLFMIYTIFSVGGLILLKAHMSTAKSLLAAHNFFALSVFLALAGALLYVASFLLWLVILGRNELSIAYPIAIGLTLVTSTIAAALILGESLTPRRLAGIAMVLAGVWIVSERR